MLAEVIAIGDELTSGQRLDTNSQWLSLRLNDLGIRVMYHTTVADDLAANVRVFREAIDRADLILASGGLGPTADDLTREAVAVATSRELVLHEPSLAHICGLFERRGRQMPERNIVQAQFPAGSRVVPNPHGTAPGIDLDVARPPRHPSRLFALPGVPAELREMWTETVSPAIRASLGSDLRIICHRTIKCFGAGESAIEDMLPDLIRRGRTPSVGITASQATITLRVTAAAESIEQCYAQMEPTLRTIRECLGTLVYGEEDDELQDVVLRLLKDAGRTLSTIEMGTGGIVSNWLHDADPDGLTYRGGMLTRHRSAIHRPEMPSHDGAEDTLGWLASMANLCRRDLGTDYALAIGPFPSQAATRPQLHLALADQSGVRTESVGFGGHPDIVRARSAKQALDFLRIALTRC